MNADQLLAHYEKIADAPEAILRLRRFILDLAVRGKLVPQDPNDEPASELLKRIAAEKARLVKGGAIKKQLPFEAVEQADVPFALPNSWEWIPSVYPSHMISDKDKKVQTKEVLDVGAFPVVDQGKVLVRGYCNEASRVIHVEQPIILFGDHTRETKLIDFDFVVGADGVKLLQPLCLSTAYYYLALQWLPLDSRGYGRHFKLLKASLIPLPPLAEQHRIVAKVDELMTLCDRLEVARGTREAARDRLTAASLARLKRPDPDEQTFRDHASFALDNLTAITTRSDQIKQLRQTILSLAVRGKLVPQDPNDEPATELLKRIAEERAELIEKEDLKPPTNLAKPDKGNLPFKVQEGWVWVSFGELIHHSESGWSPKTESFERVGNNWGVLKVSAVTWGQFLPNENKQLLPNVEPRVSAQVHQGDFLISRANTSDLVAKCVVVDQEPRNLMMSDKIVRLRLTKLCDPGFVLLLNNSAEHARAYYAENASGVSPSMKNISRPVIFELPFPLPLSPNNTVSSPRSMN